MPFLKNMEKEKLLEMIMKIGKQKISKRKTVVLKVEHKPYKLLMEIVKNFNKENNQNISMNDLFNWWVMDILVNLLKRN